MPDQLPRELTDLLQAHDGPARDAAWERFVAVHTRLLLHVTRSMARDPDAAMDAYAEVLERLREDNARRLRGFAAEGRSKFTTWLVVVSRRICVDWLRHRGGRNRPGASRDAPQPDGQLLRRRLLAMAGEPIPLEHFRQEGGGADGQLEAAEIHGVLAAALEALPAPDRLLLSLRFEDGLKASQIARVMRLPSQFHVYRRLDQVLKSLRLRLNSAGIDGPS